MFAASQHLGIKHFQVNLLASCLKFVATEFHSSTKITSLRVALYTKFRQRAPVRALSSSIIRSFVLSYVVKTTPIVVPGIL